MASAAQAKYLIIGTGIHRLSAAYHLSQLLGDGKDILVIDKDDVAASASGIACGVVRNNYYQPAMRELMAHSVDVWEAHADALHYSRCGIHAD